jgi:hypothetical protein
MGIKARIAVAALAACALSAATGGIAGAHAGAEAKTTFVDVGVSCGGELPPGKCLYLGVIDSESKKCVQGRTVEMFALLDGGSKVKLVDTGTTSKHGGFAGVGQPSDVSAAKFKVLKSKAGDITCKAKSFTGA